MFLVRTIGYFVAMAAVDIAVDYWEGKRMERKMTRYTNDNDGAVSAHVVTDDTAGTVMTPGGVSRDVSVGEVLIGTDRPDVYHVADSSALDGYTEADQPDSEGAGDRPTTMFQQVDFATESDQDGHDFDPSAHNATEVRARLRAAREAGNRAEYERISEAERNGYNRSSALDGDYDR